MTKRELTNATITHVSYVDKAANKKQFFLTKSEKQPTFNKEVKIVTKSDDAQQLVYGVVYEPEVVDAHGDFMKSEEIEKAAHGFMKDARNIDKQHEFESGMGEVVESYVAPADFTVGEATITKGSWVLVTKASDEVWESIQKGEVTGYSMAGTAEVTEIEKQENSQMKKFFETMKSFFVGEQAIQKGDVKDAFSENQLSRNLFDAFYTFENYFYSEVYGQTGWGMDADECEPDPNKILEYCNDLADICRELIAQYGNDGDEAGENDGTAMKKAFAKMKETAKQSIMKKEGTEVTKDEMKELLKSELAPVVERVSALEKAEGEVVNPEENPEEQANANEELVKSFKEVLKSEIAPVLERLETVEKARGISKAADTEGQEIEKSEENIWAGLL